jgi:type VI secretion system secreted protein Hcp
MSRRRAMKIALPAALALGAGTAVAIAAIPASDGTIHACYSTTGTPTGAARIVDETETCAATEKPLTWNQTGPTGPAGPSGPSGPPGDTGTSGSGSGSFGGTDTGSQGSDQGGGPSADIFLKLDGISGESTDEDHKGEIEVEAFTFNAKRATASGAGKVKFAPFRVIKVYDASSPKLMQAAASGRHIKSAVLSFRRSGDPSGVEFLTYKLSDVVVASYQEGGANADERTLGSLEDEIGLNPAKVQVTEKTVDASGKPGPAVGASFDIKRGK